MCGGAPTDAVILFSDYSGALPRNCSAWSGRRARSTGRAAWVCRAPSTSSKGRSVRRGRYRSTDRRSTPSSPRPNAGLWEAARGRAAGPPVGRRGGDRRSLPAVPERFRGILRLCQPDAIAGLDGPGRPSSERCRLSIVMRSDPTADDRGPRPPGGPRRPRQRGRSPRPVALSVMISAIGESVGDALTDAGRATSPSSASTTPSPRSGIFIVRPVMLRALFRIAAAILSGPGKYVHSCAVAGMGCPSRPPASISALPGGIEAPFLDHRAQLGAES